MFQKQFKVNFNNSSSTRDIRESIVFKHSQFLKMIDELNTKGEIIELDISIEEFDKIEAFIQQIMENFKGQESIVFKNLDDLKNQEQFKDLFKDMLEQQILQLLSVAEYLDIPNIIMALAAQFSYLIKDKPGTSANQNI